MPVPTHIIYLMQTISFLSLSSVSHYFITFYLEALDSLQLYFSFSIDPIFFNKDII